MSNPARFLSRWSRLKQQALAESPAAPVIAPDAMLSLAVTEGAEVPEPLAPDTGLGALLREELSEAVRKQTLKAIFADPHFNVMDGLDTYIDDYSISEPIPPEMLATLNQARFLFGVDESAKVDETNLPEVQLATSSDNLNHSGQIKPDAALSVSAEKDS